MNYKRPTLGTRLALCASLSVPLLFAACGGGGGDSTQPSAEQPAVQSYTGTLSLGDTVSVQIDAPARGQLTVSFLDSEFGLAGKLVASYTSSVNGVYSATRFKAADGVVPAALASNADGVQFDFNVNSGALNGQIQNLPNVKDGGLLSGQVLASATSTTNVASLAGSYSLIKLSGNFVSNGISVGAQDVDSGTIKINSDGSFRMCLSQPYSETCADDGGDGTPTGHIVPAADQTKFPGAYDLTLTGATTPVARLFARQSNGQTTLLMDQHSVDGSGQPRTGTWIAHTTQALTTGTYDGTWICSAPGVSDAGVMTGALTKTSATLQGSTFTLGKGGVPATTTVTYNATRSAATALTTPPLLQPDWHAVPGVDGLFSGSLGDASGADVQPFIALPVSATQIHYLAQAGGSNSDGTAFFVLGVCNKP